MPFVVTENCIRCKYTDCVYVCPVDCFHEGPNMLVIDPDACIDCNLREAECPAKAVMSADEVPAKHQHCIELNRELTQVWPLIKARKDPLPEADTWKDQANKLPLLERA